MNLLKIQTLASLKSKESSTSIKNMFSINKSKSKVLYFSLARIIQAGQIYNKDFLCCWVKVLYLKIKVHAQG